MIDTSSRHDRVGCALDDAGIAPLAVLRAHHFSTPPENLVRSDGAAVRAFGAEAGITIHADAEGSDARAM